MAVTSNIRVGDIGTLYKAEFQDEGVAFDPSLATIKRFIWKIPGGTVITRDATVVFESSKWYLEYTVTNAEPTFHVFGNYSWQGYVEFSGGERYHTNIEIYRVEKNLN